MVAMILQFAPALTCLFATCCHKDHISKYDVIAIILTVLGGFIILNPWDSILTSSDVDQNATVYGILLVSVATIFLAINNVMTKTVLVGAEACHWTVVHM